MDSKYILQSLNDTISSRKGGDPESSYVAYLFAKGQDEILKKIVEEAGEVVLASKDDDKIKVVKEIADLWFHTLVLMAQHEIHPEDILGELESRQGVSGIAEKRMRGTIFKG
ncbi:MAG: phosphoribosyl-ATP diphosphatase [Proteobacteria bacterium]|nr:phosphoribosyl-ATP diphosphatase [Pseudomonadota bacterium]|tara:strand:+ start:506 stop:841 length:336 start_codon:yes stop_codon:yes gene_type:complete